MGDTKINKTDLLSQEVQRKGKSRGENCMQGAPCDRSECRIQSQGNGGADQIFQGAAGATRAS